MGHRNLENPFGGPSMLIDRLIGSAYEVVKFVACHMDDIQIVADFIRLSRAPVTSLPPAWGSLINQVVYGDHVVFDISKGFAQELTLTGNVSSSELQNGADYAFIIIRIVQDAVGGHTFAWPPTIHSHGDIDLTPLAISQQMFARNLDGSFDLAGAMMYPNG